MNEPTQALTHPTDGDLVRYLDHQATAEERRSMLAHLTGCDACEQRVAALGEQSRMVADYLAELHADAAADELRRARALAAARAAAARRRLGVSTGWTRAAAVAAVVALVAGVSPVRAWVVDQLQGIFGDESAPQPAVVVQPRPAVELGSAVAFEPAGDVFNLELDAEQAVGEVRLTLSAGPRAYAQTIGGNESFTLLPAGVLVANAPGSTASYQISVPGSVRIVQVFAGDRLLDTVEVDPTSATWSHHVPLAAAR